MPRITILCTRCKAVQTVRVDAATHYSIACARCEFVVARIEELRGYIYILSNPLMPGVVKIGLTERDVEARLQELSSPTGVGAPFQEEARFEVCDPASAESRVHAVLGPFRTNPNREFFRISVQEAIATVSGIVSMPAIDFDAQLERVKQRDTMRVAIRNRIERETKASGVIRGGFGSAPHEK